MRREWTAQQVTAERRGGVEEVECSRGGARTSAAPKAELCIDHRTQPKAD